jgi:soluble lytic murein transglycosylase-like protein
MKAQGSAKIVRRSPPQGASLPRGRVIALRREFSQQHVAVSEQLSAVERYQDFKRRLGPHVLAGFVFLIAAGYMATRPLDNQTPEPPLDEVPTITTPATSSDADHIAQAYARFGEEVREEARKHAVEIRKAIAAPSAEQQSIQIVQKSAPTYSRQVLIGKVYKIIKRYAPRHQNPQTLAEAIVSEAEAQNYDALFVAAVIKSESAFNALARSHKGAQGLMQIMPATGKWLAKEAALPRGSLTDPGHNLGLGVRYLKQLEAQYNGDRVFTLIAYNWGPGHVESAADGKRRIPPEVVTYAIKILNDYRRWRSGA